MLFRQTRVGRDGQTFLYKFRSMVVGAEARLAQLAAPNESDGALFKMRADPRVTRVGRLLRASSLDELPQLLNVLLGQMSLVGPRPPSPSEVERYEVAAYRRLLVKPRHHLAVAGLGPVGTWRGGRPCAWTSTTSRTGRLA